MSLLKFIKNKKAAGPLFSVFLAVFVLIMVLTAYVLVAKDSNFIKKIGEQQMELLATYSKAESINMFLEDSTRIESKNAIKKLGDYGGKTKDDYKTYTGYDLWYLDSAILSSDTQKASDSLPAHFNYSLYLKNFLYDISRSDVKLVIINNRQSNNIIIQSRISINMDLIYDSRQGVDAYLSSNADFKSFPSYSVNARSSSLPEKLKYADPYNKLGTLNPKIEQMAIELITKADEAGIKIRVLYGYRSLSDQAGLYSKGRDSNGNIIDKSKIVTNAKPGSSWHNYGLAIDIGVFRDGEYVQKGDDSDYYTVGEIGKLLGFKWGGEFLSIFDPAHFEYSGNLKYPSAAKQLVLSGQDDEILSKTIT